MRQFYRLVTSVSSAGPAARDEKEESAALAALEIKLVAAAVHVECLDEIAQEMLDGSQPSLRLRLSAIRYVAGRATV
jgi:hypothetical protein